MIPVKKILAELREERRRIDAAIAHLEQDQRAESEPGVGPNAPRIPLFAVRMIRRLGFIKHRISSSR
jgi:hypothetical protein